MALLLDATVGGESSNSLVILDEAVAYMEGRMATAAWDAADQPTRERALVAATQRLEQEQYVGRKATETQALKWPRVCVFDDDDVEYAADVIPIPVKNATCELALALLASGDTDALAPTGLEQFKALEIGEIALTMRDGAPPAPGGLPASVRRWLRDLLDTPASGARVYRGS